MRICEGLLKRHLAMLALADELENNRQGLPTGPAEPEPSLPHQEGLRHLWETGAQAKGSARAQDAKRLKLLIGRRPLSEVLHAVSFDCYSIWQGIWTF